MIRTPGRAVIDKLKAVFHDYNISDGFNSNNGISFIATNGNETSFIKIVDKKQATSEGLEDVESKLKEIQSDNLIRLKSFGDLENDYQYLEFEKIEGYDLDHLDSPLNEDGVKKMVRDVSLAVKTLWEHGVVHRDIKPGNIMYDTENDRFVLVDLGIGYFIEKAHRDNTRFRSGIGSRFHSAPEQFWANSNQPYSLAFATDIFSLGSVAYKLLAGSAPHIPADGSSVKNYEDAVTGGVTPIDLREFHVGHQLADTIMKMIEKYPADRYLSVDQLRSATGIAITTPRTNVISGLHIPKDGKEDFIEYLEDIDYMNPEIVFLNTSTKNDWAEKIADNNIEIMFDPQTFKLQKNQSMANVITKLDLPDSSSYNFLDIYKLQDKMIDEVIKTPINSYANKIVLPYFDLEGANSSYVTMQREVWSQIADIKSRHSELEHKELYGGVLIPRGIIINKEARSKLLSQLLDKYELDGIYLVLEGQSSTIATTTDTDYLEGAKFIITTLESYYKKVIVSKTDISLLGFMTNGLFATGWSKSNRHLMLDSQGRRGEYKMKWFSKPLFTFVEEQSNIETLVDYGYSELLECSDPCFTGNEHLDPAYDPDEALEQRHYYHSIVGIINNAHGKPASAYSTYYSEIISIANVQGKEVKRTTSGLIDNKIIPDFEGLVALIGD